VLNDDFNYGNYTPITGIHSEDGLGDKRLLVILFALSLGLALFGVGLLGFPIFITLYGFTLISIASWGFTKHGRSFLSRLIGEKQDGKHNGNQKTNSNKPAFISLKEINKGNFKHIVEDDKKSKKSNQYTNDNKPQQATSHDISPRDKSRLLYQCLKGLCLMRLALKNVPLHL